MTTLRLFSWHIFQYLSYAGNVLFLVLWAVPRLFLKSYLAGRWEGVLTSNQNQSAAFDCILYVTRHNGRDNKAHMFYKLRDLATEETPIKGVDKLVSGDDKLWAFGRPWKATFVNEFHKSAYELMPKDSDAKNDERPSNYETSDLKPTGLPDIYDWECRLGSIIHSAKLHITINVRGKPLSFAGILSKD